MSIFECSFCLFSAVVPINVFLLTIAVEFAAAAAAHHLTTERPDGPARHDNALVGIRQLRCVWSPAPTADRTHTRLYDRRRGRR